MLRAGHDGRVGERPGRLLDPGDDHPRPPRRPSGPDGRGALRGQPEVRLLPVGGVHAGAPAPPERGVHRHRTTWLARPWPHSASRPRTWRPSTWSRDWGTGAWAGWPPACSTRWPPWTCPRWAMASATSSGSSSRPSRMAIRSSSPTTGPSTATRGSSPLPTTVQVVGFYGHTEPVDDDQGGLRARWVPGETVRGEPSHMLVPGYGTETVNILRLWQRPGRPGVVRPGPVQRRPLRGGRRGADALGEPHQGALPERQHAEPAGSCGSSSSISSSPARCGTSSAGSGSATATGRRSRTRSSSSSTTPIRCWRYPSSCGCSSTRTGSTGTRPGPSPAAPSPTPATPCCPRPWRRGRSPMFGRLLPRHLEIIYAINQLLPGRTCAPATRATRSASPGCR